MASHVDNSSARQRSDVIRRLGRLVALCWALLGAPPASAQTPVPAAERDAAGSAVTPRDPARIAEAGRHFVQNFSPNDYGEHNANWAIEQDSSGLLYVANTNGVLIFDGASWELIPTPTHSTVRSLAVDASDRVYVGAHGEVGYLRTDSAGVIEYVSLLEHLAEEDRNFTDVWQTFATSGGVYFMAPQRLMRWTDAGGFQVWPASTSFHVSFLVRDTLYVRQRGVGMLRMTDGGLRLLPGGEILSDEEVFVLLPHGEDGLLAVTRTMGVLRHDGTSFRPFSTAAADFLAENQVYHGTVLPDGSFALGTLRGGVAVIDESGAFLRTIDKSAGLRDQKIWFTFVDREDGLWLGLDDGLARVDVSSRVTYFDDEAGLEGWIGDIVRHNGNLFVATGLGVYELIPADGAGTPSSFRRIREIDASCWSLLSTEAGLLASCQDRTYEYRNGGVRTVHADGTGFSLLRSEQHQEWIFEGLNDGFAKLHLQGDRWVYAGRVAGVSEQIFTLGEDADGAVWLGTGHEGMLRLGFGGRVSQSPRIERFDDRHGLPDGWNNAFSFEGGVVMGTAQGIFRFDKPARQFIADTTLTAPFADGPREVFLLHEAATGGIWLYSDPDIISLQPREEGGFRVDESALRRLPDAQVYRFYSEGDGTLWVGRSDGLFRLDTSRPALEVGSSAMVRSVAALESDSLILGRTPRGSRPPQLPSTDNSLRFSYAFPRFSDVQGTRFQTRLDGFDQEWSEWTPASQREYTNLPHGNYVFRVRGRDAYGNVSREAAVAMSILPPWYRTWWAYLAYGLLGVGFVAAVVGWRSRRLVQQKRRLESVVRERTAEIEEQRRMLEIQAEALLEHDELKSRFFANVSHEFRTPLTLTIGPLDDLKSGLYGSLDADVEEQVDLALRNSRRLLRLINQLLDAAKLESGGMTLQLSDGNLGAHLRRVSEAFAPLAKRKGIDLQIEIPSKPILSKFDAAQLEKVFANLLSNAFKFTPRGGRMRVLLRTFRKEESEWASVSIEDSGPGIPDDQKEHIFERFYQADHARQPGGTGIGLSLAKEITELHGGRIAVESGEGAGTVFTVELPVTESEGELPETQFEISDDLFSPGDGAAARVGRAGVDRASAGSEGAAETAGRDQEDVTTVLIADDNAEVRSYLRRHFENKYRVVEADDGITALDAVRELLPDVFICDVMMPKLDGFALCKKMKSDPELDFIPVILLTGRAAADDKIEGWQEGADAYVTKPFDMAELEARVANLIAARHRLRERIRRKRAVHVAPPDVVSSDEAYLNRVRAAVEDNLGRSDFNVESLASDIGQSRVQLYRRLQALIDTSPSDFIREIRLEHAAVLLAARAGNVSEIAYGVGFKSVSHFCKCFRAQFDATPSEYMEENAAKKPAKD